MKEPQLLQNSMVAAHHKIEFTPRSINYSFDTCTRHSVEYIKGSEIQNSCIRFEDQE